jgi:O-Antigen ligase
VNATLTPPPRQVRVDEVTQDCPTAPGRAVTLTLLVGLAVFLFAYEQAGFGVEDRATIAIVVWWAVLLAVVVGFWPQIWIGYEAAVAVGCLAVLAVLTLASMSWAANDANAFEEFNRVTLFAGLLLLVLIAARHGTAGRWCDGIALGICGIAALSLFSRCFPQVIDTTSQFRFLPAAQTRLNYPIGYWNGLAVLTAAGIPLLLRVVLLGRSTLTRSVALAPLPAFAVLIYLTSSRTGTVVAVLGVLTLFALLGRRAALLAAITLASAGSAVAVGVVVRRHTLVDGPLNSSAARHEGWTAAVLTVGICVLTAAAYAVISRLLAGRLRPSRTLERGLLIGAVVLIVVSIIVSHPLRRLDDFKSPPPGNVASTNANYVRNHLLSLSGNGRWQYWTSAAHQFEHHPVLGDGAGSYQEWWLQHRPYKDFVRDAHSLYLEMLGELGILGAVLVVGFFATGFVSGFRRLRLGDERHSTTVAALLAVLIVVAVSAGADWMWELPAVGGLGVAAVGLLVGPATASRTVDPARHRWTLLAPVVAVAAAAVPVIASAGVALYVDTQLNSSEAAARRGDAGAARRAALHARSVEPWAEAPYLQLALVTEEFGNLSGARRWIEGATKRAPHDWSAWLVRARLETKAGKIPAARTSLARARELNPLAFQRR